MFVFLFEPDLLLMELIMLVPIENNSRILSVGKNCNLVEKASQKTYKDLPAEIFLYIFDFADLKTIYILKCTTYTFEQLITDSIPKKIFSKLFTHPFQLPVFLYGNLMTIEKVNTRPSMSRLDFIKLLTEKNQMQALQMFWKDVDPSSNNNYAIQWTVMNGHTEVVKLLLEDPRVNPSAADNYPNIDTITSNHIEAVKLLLQDERVDPSVDDNSAICWTSARGQTEFVKLLLQDERIDPSVDDNYAIRLASVCGHTKVVELLLPHPRVDPSAKNNWAIRGAIAEGHTEVVNLLSQDPRVNPSIVNK